MKLQKARVNFLVNSLTNATILLDTPAPQLSSSSLLKPSRVLPQNKDNVFIYLVLHNQSGKRGLDSLQGRAGFSRSALKGFTGGQKPFSICIPNWFSFPVWPDKSYITLMPPAWGWAPGMRCCMNKSHPNNKITAELQLQEIWEHRKAMRWCSPLLSDVFPHSPQLLFQWGTGKLHELYPGGLFLWWRVLKILLSAQIHPHLYPQSLA